MLNRLLIGVVVFIICGLAYSQEYNFINYGEYEGLEHPLIECIEMDSMGYTWIGTTEGLYMHDGIFFDSFRHSQDDSLSISDNHINYLHADENKKFLWIGTSFGGVNKLDLQTYKFEQIQRKADEQHKNGLGKVNVVHRLDNWLFIGTQEFGLQVYDLTTKAFFDLIIDETSNQYHVYNIIHQGHQLLIATDTGIYSYSTPKLKNENYKLEKASFCKCAKAVSSISLLNDSTLLVGFKHQLVKKNIINGNAKVLFETETENMALTTNVIDAQGLIWVGTEREGIFRITQDGKIISRFQSDEKRGSLGNSWITSLVYSANHDLLWVGTKDGLSKCSKNEIRFKTIKTESLASDGNSNIFFLFKDSKKRYWWWESKGLFVKEGDKEPVIYKSTNGYVFNKDTISCGYEDEQKQLWLGTYKGLLCIDLNNNSHRRIVFDTACTNQRQFNVITDIVPHNEKIFVLSYGGIIEYDKRTSKYAFNAFPKNFKHRQRLRTSKAAFDTKGLLWFGDREGHITSFHPGTKKFERFPAVLKTDLGKLKYNSILDLYLANDSTILLATYGTGLLSFNTNTHQVSQVLNNELLTTNIYSIYTDDEGHYWMNTNSKIVRYNIDTKQVLSFGRYDGVTCREFNGSAHFQDDDGSILMGGFGGFVEFSPQRFPFNKHVPKIDLSSYSLQDDRSVIEGQVYHNWQFVIGDTLQISTEHKPISFYASVLNYHAVEKNLVAWQLEGYESEWDTLMAFDSKMYSSLPEGTYRLRVKGSNNDQLWNNEGDMIYLVVKPTFFASRLFKGILIVLLVLTVYSAYYMRVRYLNRLKKNLESKVKERTEQLVHANLELEESKEEVIAQKHELERHRHYLEDLVHERTADLELAKEKAEESDRLKTAFLANLSHEIRTPMNSIVGFSTLLATDVYGVDERREFANVVQKSSDSLLVLINDIIDISQIETGQLKLVNKQVDIPVLSKDVFKSLRLNVNGSKVKYEFDMLLEDKELMTQTDPERLKQVLINLLNNAIKFTAKGHVRLIIRDGVEAMNYLNGQLAQVHAKSKIVLFVIEDTGIGISEKYHEHIFSPFQKVEGENAFHEGIGLGLSIVKQLVEMLGGRIWLKSKPNEGTSFYFYIPVDSQPETIKAKH